MRCGAAVCLFPGRIRARHMLYAITPPSEGKPPHALAAARPVQQSRLYLTDGGGRLRNSVVMADRRGRGVATKLASNTIRKGTEAQKRWTRISYHGAVNCSRSVPHTMPRCRRIGGLQAYSTLFCPTSPSPSLSSPTARSASSGQQAASPVDQPEPIPHPTPPYPNESPVARPLLCQTARRSGASLASRPYPHPS